MVRYAVVIGLFIASGVSAAPLGTVFCEPNNKAGNAETFVGEASGFVIGRVYSDKTLANLKLDFVKDTDSEKKIHVEKVYTAASPKYTPRNETYKNHNRFTINTDDCKFNWLLPKRLADRVNDFTGYLQQICFKHEGEKVVRVPLDTIELKCSMRSTYKLAEADESKTAVLLRDLAEKSGVGNGSADVARFSKKTFSATKEERVIARELQNDGTCEYASLKGASVAESIRAIRKQADDEDLADALEALAKDKKIFKIYSRVTTGGESEACSRYYFHVFTEDEYFLELDYDTGD